MGLNLLWIIVIGLAAGYAGAAVYEATGIWLSKLTKKPPHLDVKGYRLHHSLYGLAALVLRIIAWNVLLCAVGVGIIVQHYFTGDGLVFITRVKAG